MLVDEFEEMLDAACQTLTSLLRKPERGWDSRAFEGQVRTTLSEIIEKVGLHANPDIDQGFPDIVIGNFGVEVKFTSSDSWRSIANSVSEGQRSTDVDRIYVVFGKLGGDPEVRWAPYGESIIHVRTSHVPRFEIEIGSDRSLFEQLGISYEEFSRLNMDEKMPLIRQYARSRLKEGERLWWLEDVEHDDQQHSLPLEVKIYMDLDQAEKRRLRAEAAVISPKIVSGSRQRRKYNDAVTYLLTYRGVLCPQARDLFSAGSVAGPARGGNYLARALKDIESEMIDAFSYLEDALFVEYWESLPDDADRVRHWLKLADQYAKDWKPSENLFLAEQKKNV